MSLRLYNSLSKEIEVFEPLHGNDKVGMYTCGPTVYDYVSIGNWRTYTLSDLLYRTLKFNGYEVNYVMNITDVGHLTGDNEGDADIGEDRLEKGARREGKSAWDIADFYTEDFLSGIKKLNLIKPDNLPKATEHIKAQIEMVQTIKDKGFAYQTSDGIYFDTQAYEKAGNKYGQLSSLDEIREGARVKKNPEKKDPRDFALWKFSSPGENRHMQWQSPWGVGFPGWHIECSAMSCQYLGEQFDIHVGGEDLKSTHHPNEIAQAEAASGKKPFVKYWVHGAFLQVDGGRMGKSLGNSFTLQDIESRGFDYMALRYFYLTGHYRKPLNFTWKAMESAQNSLNSLRDIVFDLADTSTGRNDLSQDKLRKIDEFRKKFTQAVNNDLNMPAALAATWEAVKSNIPSTDKLDLVYLFDEILGLSLRQVSNQEISEEIKKLARKRIQLRHSGNFKEADKLRVEIEKRGYKIKDTSQGSKISLN